MTKYDKKETLDVFQSSFINLCNKKPFDKISMREVARDSGLSHTLLMRYYPTKRDLLICSYRSEVIKMESELLKCDNVFDICSVLLELWGDKQKLVKNFTIAFSSGSKINKEIYNESRNIIIPHLKRTLTKDCDVESEYALLCSISYYIFTLIETGEVSTDITSYKNRLRYYSCILKDAP